MSVSVLNRVYRRTDLFDIIGLQPSCVGREGCRLLDGIDEITLLPLFDIKYESLNTGYVPEDIQDLKAKAVHAIDVECEVFCLLADTVEASLVNSVIGKIVSLSLVEKLG